MLTDTVRWSTAYTYLRASFDRPLTLSSPNHPDAVDGEITIRSGDAIPSVPRHNLKGDLSVTAGCATIGATFVYTSKQFLRGDEANLLAPISGSAVMNLAASYSLGKRVRLAGRLTNLFNTTYATFGLLGEADEVLGAEFDDPRFSSPSAPRAVWVGIEYSFR